MKKAVIDIGTNSVKLTLGEAAADGGARMICDMNVITKLGEGMRGSGALSAEAMERTAQAVAKFAAFARAEGADENLRYSFPLGQFVPKLRPLGRRQLHWGPHRSPAPAGSVGRGGAAERVRKRL